jgi:NAD+ kinase
MKIYPVIAKGKKTRDVKKLLAEISKNGDKRIIAIVDDVETADAILVAGGDGTLMHVAKEYWIYNKPFFGVNRGTRGFLLNPLENAYELPILLANYRLWQITTVRLFDVTFYDKYDNEIGTELAFNDFYFKPAGTNVLEGVVLGERIPDLFFAGDGIIVSTPQGSTAYTHSAGGSILPLEYDMMAITTINSMTFPIRISPQRQKITVCITKGRSLAVVDSDSFRGVWKAVIESSKTQVNLAFRVGYDFEVKRYDANYVVRQEALGRKNRTQ